MLKSDYDKLFQTKFDFSEELTDLEAEWFWLQVLQNLEEILDEV